jgi:hypothetical protein
MYRKSIELYKLGRMYYSLKDYENAFYWIDYTLRYLKTVGFLTLEKTNILLKTELHKNPRNLYV